MPTFTWIPCPHCGFPNIPEEHYCKRCRGNIWIDPNTLPSAPATEETVTLYRDDTGTRLLTISRRWLEYAAPDITFRTTWSNLIMIRHGFFDYYLYMRQEPTTVHWIERVWLSYTYATVRRLLPLCTATRQIHPEIAERPRLEMRPNTALQLTRAARGALQDHRHFENQYRLTEALPRRGQLNARPLGRGLSHTMADRCANICYNSVREIAHDVGALYQI